MCGGQAGQSPACFLFSKPLAGHHRFGTASSLEIGGGIREGVATRKGEASSGPASSRETSRSGIGNRRDVGHGPRRVGHPRLTSPGGCGSVRRLAGPPTPFPSLFPGGPVLVAPRCAELSKGYSGQAGPCPLAPPPAQRAAVAGGCPTGSPDPAHRPAEISTVPLPVVPPKWETASAHINHIPLQEVPPRRRPPDPRQGPSAFYVTTTS